MGEVVYLPKRDGRALTIPCVDLEGARLYVSELPALGLLRAMAEAWRAVRSSSGGDVAYNLYVVAFIASRLADERILEAEGMLAGLSI